MKPLWYFSLCFYQARVVDQPFFRSYFWVENELRDMGHMDFFRHYPGPITHCDRSSHGRRKKNTLISSLLGYISL